MVRRITSLVAATLLTMALLQGSALANKPLQVDCEVLESALIAADANLPEDAFDNLGQMVSTAITDLDTFNQLNGLIELVSGGAISFDDPREVMPTVAKCGLASLLGDLVRN